MLQLLHIENIAVIEQADIDFQPGFNALTGETGAGKSIVIDALGAVLGQRTSRDLIRTGAPKAFVSALFNDVSSELPGLKENGIEPESDGTLLLQRDIYADGKNTCRAGGRPITVAQLRMIGMALLNIHGQHEGTQLLDEEQHGMYLDRFGHTEEALAAYAKHYHTMRATMQKIAALQIDEAEKERRADTLRHQISELERAGLQEGEEEDLMQRLNILRSGEKFVHAIEQADYAMSGGEENLGAVAQIQEARRSFHGTRNLGEQFDTLGERLESLYCEAYDLAETIRDMRQEFDFSPQELERLESRYDVLYRLEKKYGPTVKDMLLYLEQSRKELDEIEYADDRILQLKKELAAQQEETKRSADALSQARKITAQELEKRILQELSELDMKKVRFTISFSEKQPDESGIDVIRFLMSANIGEELKPIHKIASGGELARIMLALKNVLAEQDHVATMVFDEVDTGVSGRAAQRVAEKMARISQHKQVLCVTHLPQLAAMADTHFSVEKGEESGRTYTRVLQLDRIHRQKELARLIGGDRVTQIQLQSAEELLCAAEEYKASR